jgi:hypothetical protein
MTTGSCFVCDIPTTNLCSSCKSVSYCNKEHQKKVRSKHYTQYQLSAPNPSPLFRSQDWKSHKEYCLKVKAAGDNTFDAILFAVNETKPRLIKIPWELIPGDKDDPTPWQKLDNSIWFKKPNSFVRTIYVHRWGINGPRLQHSLCFEYDDNSLINGLPLNRCVESVTKGKAGHPWCGNLLALRMEGSYDFYKSVDMEEDLKPLVTYLEEYGKVMPGDQYQQDGSA